MWSEKKTKELCFLPARLLPAHLHTGTYGSCPEEPPFPRVYFRPISSFTGAFRDANSLLRDTLIIVTEGEESQSHSFFVAGGVGIQICVVYLFIYFFFLFSLATFSGRRSLQLAACVLTACGTVKVKRQIERSKQLLFCRAWHIWLLNNNNNKKRIHVLTLSLICLLFISYFHLVKSP